MTFLFHFFRYSESIYNPWSFMEFLSALARVYAITLIVRVLFHLAFCEF
jgi:hypothetical protein